MDEPLNYPPPLDRLFRLGEVEWGVEWQGTDPDYVAELGLAAQHVPALLAIARLQVELEDFPDDDSGWAPVHAWRALGQLRASEAVEPLLDLLSALTDTGDDYHMYDFPVVFGLIGPPAIPAVAAYLRNAENPLYSRITAASGVCNIGLQHPAARLESLGSLMEQLGRFEENDYELNGFLVADLTRLKAVEAADVIERAFASDCVAEDISGYWGAVRRELGVEGQGLAPDEPPCPPQSRASGFGWSVESRERGPRDRQKEKAAKAKRKQQEKAKKRNRKRR